MHGYTSILVDTDVDHRQYAQLLLGFRVSKIAVDVFVPRQLSLARNTEYEATRGRAGLEGVCFERLA